MRSRTLYFARHGIMLCLLSLTVALAGPGWCFEADMPVPDWMETTAVAEKMVINGLPSQVHYFSAQQTVEELLDYYRLRWDDTKAGGKGYREVNAQYWRVISKLQGRYLLTVQARSKDAFTSEGYLAVADLQDIEGKNRETAVTPKMNGSEIINESTSIDGDTRGRTLLIVNSFSTATNSDYYRDHYLSRGWGQVMDQGSDSTRVLVFGRRGRTAHLVIDESGGTTRIVMNLVEEQ